MQAICDAGRPVVERGYVPTEGIAVNAQHLGTRQAPRCWLPLPSFGWLGALLLLDRPSAPPEGGAWP